MSGSEQLPDTAQTTRASDGDEIPGAALEGDDVGAPSDADAKLSTRTRAGQLLRDVARHLDDALVALVDDTSPSAVEARARLEAAREAVALLALERAAPAVPSGSSGSAPPVLVRRAVLAVATTAPEAARSFCRETCEVWAVEASVVAAVIDVASELVSNAVKHASRPVVLALERTADGMRVSVWDDGPGRPRVLPYRPGISDHGIGMRLISHLSERWGCSEDQDGKWVWARLPLRVVRPSGARGAG